MRITVLGGKGLLGQHLTPLLEEAGHEVTIASRSADGSKQVAVDLASGDGLSEALGDADVVVHLASDARRARQVDVDGTKRILEVIDGQHIVYMSIVGVDSHPFAYYRAKYEVEQLIADSGVPHSILRATQFHDFVAFFLGAACRPPVAVIPKRFVFQPIDSAEVAIELASLVHDPRPGVQDDLCGPEILTAEHLARTLMIASGGKAKPLLNLPVPGKAAAAFRSGVHTNPDRAVGVRTWGDFLSDQQP